MRIETETAEKARRVAAGLKRWRRWAKASELQRLIDDAVELLGELAKSPQKENKE